MMMMMTTTGTTGMHITWARGGPGDNFVRLYLIFSAHSLQFPPLHSETFISTRAPRRKSQVTLRFIGHSRFVGPQFETCFTS